MNCRALSHIMLLCPDGYDKDMVDIFGADILEDFFLELRNKYVKKTIKFDPDMFSEVKNTVEVHLEIYHYLTVVATLSMALQGLFIGASKLKKAKKKLSLIADVSYKVGNRRKTMAIFFYYSF